jgi:hypothetical protein
VPLPFHGSITTDPLGNELLATSLLANWLENPA